MLYNNKSLLMDFTVKENEYYLTGCTLLLHWLHVVYGILDSPLYIIPILHDSHMFLAICGRHNSLTSEAVYLDVQGQYICN